MWRGSQRRCRLKGLYCCLRTIHPLQWPLMAWKRLSGGRSFKLESNGGVSTFLFNVHFWESHKKKSNGGANIWGGKVKSRKRIYRGLFSAAWSVPIATNVCKLMIKQRQKIQNRTTNLRPACQVRCCHGNVLLYFWFVNSTSVFWNVAYSTHICCYTQTA